MRKPFDSRMSASNLAADILARAAKDRFPPSMKKKRLGASDFGAGSTFPFEGPRVAQPNVLDQKRAKRAELRIALRHLPFGKEIAIINSVQDYKINLPPYVHQHPYVLDSLQHDA